MADLRQTRLHFVERIAQFGLGEFLANRFGSAYASAETANQAAAANA